jgi:hypothetical protein
VKSRHGQGFAESARSGYQQYFGAVLFENSPEKCGFVHIVFVLLDQFMKNFGSYTNRLKHDQSSYAAKLSYTSDHKGLSQTLQCFDHRSMRSAHFDIFPSVKAEETRRRTKQDGLLPVGFGTDLLFDSFYKLNGQVPV